MILESAACDAQKRSLDSEAKNSARPTRRIERMLSADAPGLSAS